MRFLTTLSVLALAGIATSQVTATGELTADMTAKASCGTNSKTDTEKKGTKFTRGIGAFAGYYRCSNGAASGSVGRHTNWWTKQTTTSARANSSSSVYGSKTTSKGSGSGNSSQKFTFTAPKDTSGKLVVTVGGRASAKQTATASVKFGSTTLTWKAGEKPKTHTATIKIGAKGMMFEARTSASSALTGRGWVSASSYVSISFIVSSTSTGKCTITNGAKGCGPTLAGTSSSSWYGHSLTLKLKGAYANSIGLRAWSPDGKVATVQGCPIFTNIGPVFAFQTDKNGEATHVIRFRSGNFKWSVEDVVLRLGPKTEWKATNTLNIVCTK